MKILLVGGSGFIGKRFIRNFAKTDQIIVYAIKEDIEKAKEFLDEHKIETIEGAVEDATLPEIIKKENPNVVIHLAALTGLVKCHNNPQMAFKINVYGTYNVVNACSDIGCKLIFISSREVYGETLNQTTTEDDVLLPNNVYGITKMMGENIIQFFSRKQNLDFTVLRLTNVYGPEGDQYGAQVIIKKALTEKKIQILGGTQRLNYVFVDDVIDIIHKCITNPKSSKEIFNVGSKDTLSIKEFVNKVVKVLNENIEIEYKPMRETETTNFEPNLSKLSMLEGIPMVSIEDGLRKTIEWYKAH